MLLTAVLSYIFLLNGSFSRAEPVCSKFHFEEKTLEKMIRQEIHVEKMKAEMKDTKQQVLEALVNLKNEREKFADDTKRKKNEIELLNENMKNARDLVKEQTETHIKDYKAKLEKIKDSVVTPAIAFKAIMVSDTAMSENKVIVFTENLLNTDNAYNNETGIFVAPVAGIYYFAVQLCLPDYSHSYYSISLNDVNIARSIFGRYQYNKCYNMDALTLVEKSDTVSVKCSHSCKSDKLFDNQFATSSFSGVLLHKQR